MLTDILSADGHYRFASLGCPLGEAKRERWWRLEGETFDVIRSPRYPDAIVVLVQTELYNKGNEAANLDLEGNINKMNLHICRRPGVVDRLAFQNEWAAATSLFTSTGLVCTQVICRGLSIIATVKSIEQTK
jgi:hypothetical protein